MIFWPLQWWVKQLAWRKITIALILGAICGLIFGNQASYLKPIGTFFIQLISMMIVPLVFTVIVCAVVSMQDFQKMKRISIKAIGLYIVCMAFAAFIGIIVAIWFAPGEGFPLLGVYIDPSSQKTIPTVNSLLEGIIPKNPFQAFAEGNIIQIVIFAILFGISVNLTGEKGKVISDIFRSLSSIVFKFAGIIMEFAPYGIFALIAWTFGTFGWQAFWPLILFVVTVYVACILQFVCIYIIPLWIFTGIKPAEFIRNTIHPISFAFTTCSSAATLPLSIQCVKERWSVPDSIAEFLLPLGASFNLNGLSIYLGVASIFAANVYGIELHLSEYLTIVFTIVFTSMGVAAVPGSALIVMSVVMSSVGIPVGAIGIIAGVDRINDMIQTATNVAGDIYATIAIAKTEKP